MAFFWWGRKCPCKQDLHFHSRQGKVPSALMIKVQQHWSVSLKSNTAPPAYDFVKEKSAHLSFASCPSLITSLVSPDSNKTQVQQTPKWNWPKTTPTDFQTVKLPFELSVYIFTYKVHLLQNNRKNADDVDRTGVRCTLPRSLTSLSKSTL